MIVGLYFAAAFTLFASVYLIGFHNGREAGRDEARRAIRTAARWRQ